MARPKKNGKHPVTKEVFTRAEVEEILDWFEEVGGYPGRLVLSANGRVHMELHMPERYEGEGVS